MEHKRLSRWLIAAGIMAAVGLCIVFLHPGLTTLSRTDMRIFLIPLLIPYLLAIGFYLRICMRIGRNHSFCMENVRDMRWIARMLYIATGFWLIGLVSFWPLSDMRLSRMDPTSDYNGFIHLVCGLAAMASLALGILAQVLSRLLNSAARLQQENDLTI